MTVQPVIEGGAVIDIPLNKLKKSPKNARKTPDAEAAIEALAASIAAKGMLQAPVVEPEIGEDGEPTGFWLVTIGEGRRLAMLLRAKRKEVRKAEPVRCVVDTNNDAHEISLDENVNINRLVISECRADDGPLAQGRLRFRPGPQGRAMPFAKRLSHLTVKVREVEEIEEAPKAKRGKPAKKA